MSHHWEGVEPEPEKYFGFVYCITNKLNGRQYIGKKQFMITRRIKVPGKKNRKIYKASSGWEYYTGSSVWLNKEIQELGKENFKFEILNHASSKGTLHYMEIELQTFLDVLKAKLPDGTPAFYNRTIAGVKFIPKDEYPEIAEKQRGLKNTIFKAIANGNHPTLGKGHKEEVKKKMSERAKRWWSSLTEEEVKEHAQKTANKGQRNGRAKLTEDQVKEIRENWEQGLYRFKRQIAKKYGVGDSQVNRILSGEHWKGEGNDETLSDT